MQLLFEDLHRVRRLEGKAHLGSVLRSSLFALMLPYKPSLNIHPHQSLNDLNEDEFLPLKTSFKRLTSNPWDYGPAKSIFDFILQSWRPLTPGIVVQVSIQKGPLIDFSLGRNEFFVILEQ